ncbi:MAG TPA: M3 family metallopeptidase, partial [Deinococcales bacterium]|nr:M3 family metallopeptidase [Deinococcales bacterium]
QDWKQEITIRKYDSPIAPTVLRDELEPEIVEAVMSVTERNYRLAQRWYEHKARVLGLKDFSSFDTLAPLQHAPRRVSFDEARGMVLAAMGAFAPQAGEIAADFFNGRIDVLPRPGKRGGAFCSSFAPQEHAYVLLNFNGRLDDAFTLAHELGHGLHAELGRQQRLVNYGHSLPLAETASTFNEMVLADYLLRDADEEMRRDLMATRVQDAVNTILRQVQITRWEQRAHEARAQGVVSSDAYSDLWMAEWTKLHGNAVNPVAGERWGWSVIPHVVNSRFYCYSYAFGMLLVMALFQQYKADAQAFVPKYLNFLASANSRTPAELLASLGVNAQDPKFWQGGFDYLWATLSELTGRNERPADLDD